MRVGEQRVLDARAAITFGAVAGARDDEQRAGVGGAEARHVHRQHFAVAADERVDACMHLEAAGFSGSSELGARLGVALCEESFGVVHRRRVQR